MVNAFDEDRGLGTVMAEDGHSYPFHCASVADGTRKIAVGTAVVFVAFPGHGGRYEARKVAPDTPGGAASAPPPPAAAPA